MWSATLALGLGGGLGDQTREQLQQQLAERKKKIMQPARVDDPQRQGYTTPTATIRGLLGGPFIGAIGNGY